jgi:hypothetical protein
MEVSMSEVDFWKRNNLIVYERMKDAGGSEAVSTVQVTDIGEEQVSFNLWSREKFPIVYEGGEAKAVLVDVVSFAQIELILDNLFNREVEVEDAVLAASTVLDQLIMHAQKEKPSVDWEKELNEL